jgi:ubiquinone/menaquinone biosynthesis C-methylase UbiE
MKSDVRQLAKTWEELGNSDPLWAVVTDPEKRGGRWEMEEFLQTGERSISTYSELISKHSSASAPPAHVLDFGCGVGRLTCAWSKRATRVTGVDISEPMLRIARQTASGLANVTFILNQSEDLRVLKDGEFDLVFSVICLQHMPWSLAASYIREFARVCRPGGVVAFQVPARETRVNRMSKFRQKCVESLPFGLGRIYRRWRHGSSSLFEMNYTPASVVEAVGKDAGLRLLHREPDNSAGPGTEGFFFIFRRS